MNRIVFGGIAVIATIILAWTIFISFFAVTDAMHAEAFVVIAPVNDRGAILFSDITKTAHALTQTHAFRAAFINDLTLSGIAFDQEDLYATIITQRAPGLIGIDVHGDNTTQISRVATSAAYSLVHTIQHYYATIAPSLKFTVIDGAVVTTQTSQSSPLLGAMLSVAISALIVTLIFVVVFSFLRQKRQLRSYGTIHASHARLDLKFPQKKAATNHVAGDYMHNIYNEYDASLEALATTDAAQQHASSVATSSTPDDAIATKDVEDTYEHDEDVHEEMSTTEHVPQTKKEVQELSTQQSTRDTTALVPATTSEKATKVLHTLSALIKEKQQEVRSAIKNNVAKTTQKIISQKHATSENATAQHASAPSHVATHAAPPNLPVMHTSEEKESKVAPSQSMSTTPENDTTNDMSNATQEKEMSSDDPTPEEIRRRLNELLKGYPPSALENKDTHNKQ